MLDNVFCAEEKGELVVVVVVGEQDVIGVCAAAGWERKRMGGRLVPFGVGPKIGEVCACRERTGARGQAMPASSLKDLDVENSLGEEGAVRGAAVKHVWKR